MNQHIRDLARESGVWFMDNQDRDEIIEKFAQLIVQACLQKCEAERQEFSEQAALNNGRESDFAFGSVNSAERIASSIKQHFGIE